MSHAYARNYLHLVFATKERRRFLKESFREDAYQQLRDIAREYGAEVDCMGGTEDHVHILLLLPPKISVVTLVQALKGKSSKWINDHGHLFVWQVGYGCFSVSASNLGALRDYIRKQEEHHRKRSFTDEFAALLRKHGIEFNSEHSLGD